MRACMSPWVEKQGLGKGVYPGLATGKTQACTQEKMLKARRQQEQGRLSGHGPCLSLIQMKSHDCPLSQPPLMIGTAHYCDQLHSVCSVLYSSVFID